MIYYRARHDFRYCSCGDISVDGGFDYLKICFKKEDNYKIIKINVKTTKEKLYLDWNGQKNKYGIIKSKK